MAKDETEVRIAVALPQALRDELTDVAYLMRINEKDLVVKALAATIKSLKDSKGEKFTKALEIIKAAREE